MAVVPSIGRAHGIDGASAPEADATRELYERYANQIFRYCLHQLGSREEAEDAVQSTFLNAFRGIKRGVTPEVESAWLFKIAHNVCLSRRRSTWRRGRIESPTDFEVVEDVAPAPSRRADELIGLQDVLERMPEQQRRAILLREWQGLSYHEIGEELELSQPAVETLIFRARRSLAQGLEQPGEVAKRRRRVGAGALGNLLSSAQGFFFSGGAAVKVAATVAAVGAGTVAATEPMQRHQRQAPPPKQHTQQPAAHRSTGTPGATSGAVTTPAHAGGVQRSIAPTRATRPVRGPAVAAPPAAPHPPAAAPPATEAVAEPAPPPVASEPAATPPPVEQAPPPPAAPRVEPPGQAKKDAPEPARPVAVQPLAPTRAPASNRGHGSPNAPGQAKKAEESTSASPMPLPTEPPGQAKKSEAAVEPPVVATPVEPSAHGHGQGKGREK